jgi:transcriptional regulator with XRE-family HTH domain
MSFTGEHLQFISRIKKGKQSMIAKKLMITQQAVSKLEKQKIVSEEKFDAYIKALGITKAEAIKLLELFIPPPRKMKSKIKLFLRV